jgi:molybdopterin-guanine dinucleotide biosynthesis protein A
VVRNTGEEIRSLSKDSFDAIILSGGKSERFGADKCAYVIDGKTMLERVAGNFSDPIIVARDRYPVKWKVVIDPLTEERNPLIGLKKGMEHVKSEKVFITGCDFPFLKRSVVDLICSKKADVSLPFLEGTVQPLLGCYSTSHVRKRLKYAQSLKKIVFTAKTIYLVGTEEIRSVDPTLRSLVNVNTFEDLHRKISDFTKSRLIIKPKDLQSNLGQR